MKAPEIFSLAFNPLNVIVTVMLDWEQFYKQSDQQADPRLLSLLKVVQASGKAAIGCATDDSGVASEQALTAAREFEAWTALTAEEFQVSKMSEEFGSMVEGVGLMARDLAEWEAAAMQARAQFLNNMGESVEFTSGDHTLLSRARALLACFETMLAGLYYLYGMEGGQDPDSLEPLGQAARYKALAAFNEIEAWHVQTRFAGVYS